MCRCIYDYVCYKIVLEVIGEYYTDGFWVSRSISNGKYAITREKLTEKQYKKIRDNIKLLNKNGYKKMSEMVIR